MLVSLRGHAQGAPAAYALEAHRPHEADNAFATCMNVLAPQYTPRRSGGGAGVDQDLVVTAARDGAFEPRGMRRGGNFLSDLPRISVPI